MIRIIGPDSELTAADVEMLSQFFSEQTKKGINFWSSKQVYCVSELSTGAFQAIQFKYDLFQRKRKDQRPGVRYEFIGNLFDKGGFAHVHHGLGTLALDIPLPKIKRKPRLIKEEHKRNEFTFDFIQREYRMAFKGGLGAKEPVFVNNERSLLVMKKMPGCSMFDLLSNDLDDLNSEKRLRLTKNLLIAAKIQLAQHGIIHQDLAPENVIIDLTNETFAVSIVDFGLSFSLDDDGGRRGGKAAYVAPEAFDELYTDRYDVYALGKLIAMIWNVNFNYAINWYDNTHEEIKTNASTIQLEGLFEGLDDLTSGCKLQIELFLRQMLEPDPMQRLSLDEAIQWCESIDIPQQYQVAMSSSGM